MHPRQDLVMNRSKETAGADRNFAACGETAEDFDTHRERAKNPQAAAKPQIGRPPNRPPYEQHLRVTKAFLK
jgi:hypothetical protein